MAPPPKSSLSEEQYRRYFAVVRAKCTRMLSDPEEAADVAQEVLIRLWHSGPHHEAAGPELAPRTILAWLYRTSTRVAIDHLRQRKARHRLLETTPALPELPPLCEDALFFRRALERLAATIPADELEVVILDRLDQLTQVEIASVTGVSERTVRRLLQRFDARVQPLREEMDHVRTA
ncbi:MAG: RNA polymerase sigma factor [Polyangia bacterium]